MISDEDLSQLPADPGLAFVQFEKILRERVEELEKQEAGSQGDFNADPYRLQYINKVHAAATVYGIDIPAKLHAANFDFGRFNVVEEYRQFRYDVDHVTTQLRLRAARNDLQSSVSLDEIVKAKIHHFIKEIRKAVERSELSDDKRDALYNKLDKFAAEVDRKRTSLQAGMSVYITICDDIAQGFEKLEPARMCIDSIGALLGRAKESEDRAKLRLPPAEAEPADYAIRW